MIHQIKSALILRCDEMSSIFFLLILTPISFDYIVVKHFSCIAVDIRADHKLHMEPISAFIVSNRSRMIIAVMMMMR